MSALIESTARGIIGSLPGSAESTESSRRLDERGSQLIRNWATGGLALGGGVGAAVALINYLKSLRREAELEDDSRLNDDTLYIPAVKSAASGESSVNRWLAPGLAVTGGILTTGGAYALTQAVYNWLQKKKRQRLLDEAQAEALLTADAEAAQQKSASDGVPASMTLSDLLTAFPVAVPLLTALASGGVAYAALNKAFPTIKRPSSKYPKRVRQVGAEGEVTDVPVTKTAARRDFEDAGYEFLLLNTDALAVAGKSASLTSDLLHRAAVSGVAQLSKDLQEHGLFALCSMTKGASAVEVSVCSKAAAAAAIVKDPALGPVAGFVAAAEWMDMLPAISGYCGQMSPPHLRKMAKLASLLHLNGGRGGVVEFAKSAATTGSPLLDELLATMAQPDVDVGAPLSEEEQRDKALTSDVGGSLSEDDEGETDEDDVDTADESQAANDIVDAAFEEAFASPEDEAAVSSARN
jgi:hypothetical protein